MQCNSNLRFTTFTAQAHCINKHQNAINIYANERDGNRNSGGSRHTEKAEKKEKTAENNKTHTNTQQTLDPNT